MEQEQILWVHFQRNQSRVQFKDMGFVVRILEIHSTLGDVSEENKLVFNMVNASNLLHEGINLSAVKDLLGHSDETTTLKHYIYNTDSKDETKKAVLNVMEEKKN